MGTALTFSFSRVGSRCKPGAGQAFAVRVISATDIDPSPGVPHANGAAYRRSSPQVKTRALVVVSGFDSTGHESAGLPARVMIMWPDGQHLDSAVVVNPVHAPSTRRPALDV